MQSQTKEAEKPEPVPVSQDLSSAQSKPAPHDKSVPEHSPMPDTQESVVHKRGTILANHEDGDQNDQSAKATTQENEPHASTEQNLNNDGDTPADDVPSVKGHPLPASQVSVPSSSTAANASTIPEGASLPDPKLSDLDAKEIQLSSEAVAELLGEDAAQTFRRAMALTLASGLAEVGGGADSSATEHKAGVMLEEATRLFVMLLTQVPEDSQSCAGFAELLTGYGKSLLGFVRRAGQKQSVLGGKMEGEHPPPEEDLEDQDDNEELAWTQLEAARVAFDRLVKRGEDKYSGRLGDVHGCLGDLLLEGDAWEAASREYETASELMNGRRKAEVLYKQYLAMRRDAAAKAVEALRKSVQTFEEVESDEETIKELKDELRGYEAAVMPAVNNLKRDEKRAEDAVAATVVQPRKRAKKNK